MCVTTVKSNVVAIGNHIYNCSKSSHDQYIGMRIAANRRITPNAIRDAYMFFIVLLVSCLVIWSY